MSLHSRYNQIRNIQHRPDGYEVGNDFEYKFIA